MNNIPVQRRWRPPFVSVNAAVSNHRITKNLSDFNLFPYVPFYPHRKVNMSICFKFGTSIAIDKSLNYIKMTKSVLHLSYQEL